MSKILIKQINSSAATTGASIILDTTGKNVWTNQSTGALLLPAGSTAQEPSSPTAGMLRFNSTTSLIEYYNGTIWVSGENFLKLYAEDPVTPLANTVSGVNAITLGEGQTASGQDSITLGGANNISAGAYSATLGIGVEATLYGQLAHGNGNFSVQGDAQASQYILRNTTVGNQTSILYLDGTSARLVIPNNSAWTFKILIIARRSDAFGDYGSWEVSGAIKRDSGVTTTALIGLPLITKISTTNTQISINIVADTGTGSLKITVSNTDATKSYNWVARVDTVEIM